MQGIAGAIDRFGQAFGPLVGGAALHFLGEAGLMRWTGLGLAAISSVCMLFIGDGCVNWARNSCMRSLGGGYTPISQGHLEIDQADEMEMADVATSPTTKDLSTHINGEEYMGGDKRTAVSEKFEPDSPTIEPIAAK